jgi:hypothetical protein
MFFFFFTHPSDGKAVASLLVAPNECYQPPPVRKPIHFVFRQFNDGLPVSAKVPSKKTLSVLFEIVKNIIAKMNDGGPIPTNLRFDDEVESEDWRAVKIYGPILLRYGELVFCSVVWRLIDDANVSATQYFVPIRNFLIPPSLSDFDDVLRFVQQHVDNNNPVNWTLTFSSGSLSAKRRSISAFRHGEAEVSDECSGTAMARGLLVSPSKRFRPEEVLLAPPSPEDLITDIKCPFLSQDINSCVQHAFENATNEKLQLVVPPKITLVQFQQLLYRQRKESAAYKYQLSKVTHNELSTTHNTRWTKLKTDKMYLIVVKACEHVLGIGRNLILDCNPDQPYAVKFKPGAEGMACAATYRKIFGFDIVAGLVCIYEIVPRPRACKEIAGFSTAKCITHE